MKLQAPSNPKFLLLLDRTGLRLHQVAGLLELTWLFVAEHAPQGNIGKWPNSMIERVIDWPGEQDEWIDALVEVGFLCRSNEHRLIVHDWPDHCPEMIRKRLSRVTNPGSDTKGVPLLSCRLLGCHADATQQPSGSRTAARVGSGRATPGRVGPGGDDDDAKTPSGFEEGDDGAWIANQLRLRAKSTAEERALWLEAKFVEISARARVEHAEADGVGKLADRGTPIASARWNKYLQERNPDRREFFMEAAARESAAALADSKASDDQPDPTEFPDDDPLSDLTPSFSLTARGATN